MKLFVKTATTRFALEVNPDETIASVKSKVQEKISNQIRYPGDQKVVFRGNVLQDSAVVNSVLAELDTILFLYRLVDLPKEDEPMPDIAPSLASAPAPSAVPAVSPDLQAIIGNLVGSFSASMASHANAAAPAPASSPAAAPAQSPIQPAAPRQPTQLLTPPGFHEALAQLMDMGFSESRCKKALYLNSCNFELALEWIFNNADSPTIDSPLTDAEMTQIAYEWRALSSSSTSAPAASPLAPLTIDQRLQQAIANHKCTYTVTGNQYANQTWYYCYTCGLVDSEGLCEACKDVCHKGHLLSEAMPMSSFYCDCGSGSKCKAKN